MWRPLQRHSQVGSLQGRVLERLCGTPELQTQLQPKRVLAVKLSNLERQNNTSNVEKGDVS